MTSRVYIVITSPRSKPLQGQEEERERRFGDDGVSPQRLFWQLYQYRCQHAQDSERKSTQNLQTKQSTRLSAHRDWWNTYSIWCHLKTIPKPQAQSNFCFLLLLALIGLAAAVSHKEEIETSSPCGDPNCWCTTSRMITVIWHLIGFHKDVLTECLVTLFKIAHSENKLACGASKHCFFPFPQPGRNVWQNKRRIRQASALLHYPCLHLMVSTDVWRFDTLLKHET